MKFLRESNFDLQVKENKDSKELYFEGIFIQLDKVNRNNRFYPSEEIAPIIEKYIEEQVKTGGAVGEADHPTNPNLNVDRISHRIVELRREGNNYVGKALILDTPMGNVLRGLLKGGVKFGVSTRAVGKVSLTSEGTERVSSPFVLVTAGDVVMNPSAPDAYVNQVNESQEWTVDAQGKWVSKANLEEKFGIPNEPVSVASTQAKFENFERFLKKF